jgi:hypothetical protein
MPVRRSLAWIELTCAVLMALLFLAINIPNFCPTAGDSYRWWVGGRVALVCALVAGIVFGRKRSRALRVTCWALLLALVLLVLRL